MNRRKKAENPENMSLVGHLREIRNRIAVSIAAFVVAFIACFAVIKPLADALLHMGIEYGFAYVYLAPSELLTAYVKLSLVVALVIVSPVLLSQLWGFCRSGAYEHRKGARSGRRWWAGCASFFLGGHCSATGLHCRS